MEEALYGPGGYYARDEIAIGPEGDFVTGSALSPLFGRATARVVGRLSQELDRPADYLEVGYGGAEHLEAVMDALGNGLGGRILAWDRIAHGVPSGAERLASLGDLEAGSLEGLVFSYELFDALPVHRLIGRSGGEVGELWVDWRDDEGFVYVEGQLSNPGLADLLGGQSLREGQVADLAPGWRPLYRDLARVLGRGLIVTCDYGFERAQLLDPRVRLNGTLACYSRHRVHRDAFRGLGEEDLTAHVDWTALRQAGEAEGLETVILTRQARWLLAAGISEDLEPGTRPSAQARMLLDLGGMGEEIRVLVQARDVRADRILDLAAPGARAPRSP